MAKWRPVDVRVWTDGKFMLLSDDGKLLWLYLLTSQFGLSIPGVLVAGDMAIAEQLEWTVERVKKGYAELLGKGLSVKRHGRLCWLPKALQYQPICGPKHIEAMRKIWDDVPHCAVKIEIWQALKIACRSWDKLFTKGFPEPHPIPHGEGIPTVSVSVSGTVTVQEEPPKPPKGGTVRVRSKSTREWPPEILASADRVLEKLTAYSGVKYRSHKHTDLVAARLTEGIDELELRAIVAYCGNKWADDAKMRQYLRPKTLFGPEKVHDYLDEARTEYADVISGLRKDKPEQPKLEVVK